tara:strand:+ start:637 stop:2823 length:2187 start_codon:yes stop_codon:yes gene_type:complete
MSLYFSKKQYFRDTTAREGLAEQIPFQSVAAVKPKQTKFPNPTLLDQKEDYFGNTIYTYRDINGQIRKASLMKGANKPRGVDAKVRWGMTPNRFKRGRGIRGMDGFITPPPRRNETTEFFKSRYQSAYGEMLITQKVKEADKLSGKKTKVLKESLKKKEEKIEALVLSNAETQRRLRDENKRDLDVLRLQLGNLSNGGMRGGGEYTGGGGGGLRATPDEDAKPPPEEKPKKSPEDIDKEIEARKDLARGGGEGGDLLEQLKKVGETGLTGAQFLQFQKTEKAKRKAEKEAKRKSLIAGGADEPSVEGGSLGAALAAALGEPPPPAAAAGGVAIDFSKLPPPDEPPGKGKGKKGKKGKGGRGEDLSLELDEAEKQREEIAERRKKSRGASAEPSSPLARVPSGGTQFSALKPGDTPRKRGNKLKFFGRRGLEGGLEEIDIDDLDETGVKNLVGSTTFNQKEKTEILKGLKGKMKPSVKAEAEKQLALLAGEIGETAAGTIGGEKQTSTPRPTFDEPFKVGNPIDDESTDEEIDEPEFSGGFAGAAPPPEPEPAPPPPAPPKPKPEKSAPAPKSISFLPDDDENEIRAIISSSDNKGDYFDNLQVYNQQRLAQGKEPFTSSFINKMVDIYPKRPQGTTIIRGKPKEEREAEGKQKVQDSKDRQIKILTDKYPLIEFGRSNKTKLTQLLGSIKTEAEFDRGVRDINNVLSLQGKQRLRNDVITKTKEGKFV